MKQSTPADDLNHHTRSSRVIPILILAGWVVFQFWIGNRIYAAFLCIFFVAFAHIRRSNFLFLAIPVLLITLFSTQTINALAPLKRWNLNAVQNYKRTLINIFTPGSGQEVLPDTVQQMLFLLHEHDLDEYSLSEQLNADLRIHQRIVESAWPIRLDHESANLLGYIEEINQNTACTIVDQTEDVALANCQ